MPVILEEVNPSWVEDGWGIQGDQNEVRFDDDIPWDITAWTRDHPDQSDFNCCAPPPTGCPSVTLNGLEFCCVPSFIQKDTLGGIGACCDFGTLDCHGPVTRSDCISSGGVYRGDGSLCVTNPCGSVKLYEDEGNDLVLNGVKQCTLSLGAIDPCDLNCINTPTCTLLGLHVYPSEDCSGVPVDLAIEIEVYVTHVSGVYYVFALNGGNNVILFYGTTTALGVPATNEVVCGTTTEYDNDGAICLFGGPITALGIAGNGSATIGSPCPTGACCDGFGGCDPDFFQNICEDCFARTYAGDGTTCDPNPC